MQTAGLRQTLKNSLPKPFVEALISLKYSGTKLGNSKAFSAFTGGRRGIEIGGPSLLFKTILPVYKKIKSLDGVNFSSHTVWEGDLQSGRSFNYFSDRKGTQYICDATDLAQIKSSTYDFLLSSNCLEHIANPMKALTEWARVLKPGGAMILVLPNKASNFDHARPVTTFEHLLADHESGKTEDDLTHLDEILALHDLSMDPQAGDLQSFKQRSLDNFNNRTLHHHIFDLALMKQMLGHLGFNVIETAETEKDHFALAIKTP